MSMKHSPVLLKEQRDRAEARYGKAQAALNECAEFLKDGESVRECIERNRRDIDALLTLLAGEKQQVDILGRRLDRLHQEECDVDTLHALKTRAETAEKERDEYKDVLTKSIALTNTVLAKLREVYNMLGEKR